MFPETFTMAEILEAARQLPIRVQKREDRGALVRTVMFNINAEHRSSAMSESTSKIDLDKAVTEGVKRQLADVLAGSLQKRMRENRKNPARRHADERTRRWMERMLRVYADPDARRQVEFLIDGLPNRESFDAKG